MSHVSCNSREISVYMYSMLMHSHICFKGMSLCENNFTYIYYTLSLINFFYILAYLSKNIENPTIFMCAMRLRYQFVVRHTFCICQEAKYLLRELLYIE